MVIYTDYLGNNLNIGDKCVFLKNVRTGSSTIRKMFRKGTIQRFTPASVVFENNVKASSDEVIKVSIAENDLKKWNEEVKVQNGEVKE